MGRAAAFFGFTDEDEKVLRLAKIMMILVPLVIGVVALSSTYHLIFVADALGGGEGMYLQGLALIGVLVVVRLAVQTLLDYPTGAVGDWIGHRFVIASAYMTYGLALFITSLLTPATPFWVFFFLYALWGFASSQESGAWMAWFDSNYTVAAPGDADRKQYGVFMGRMGMVFQIIVTAALIPGAILAVLFGRAWVFQLEAVICVFVALAALRLVKDFPEVQETREEQPSMGEYVEILKSGVRFLFSDPFVKWFILGGTVIFGSLIVWAELIIFPLYFVFLLTDVAVAGFRTLLFIPGVFTEERSGVWSQRFEPKKWIPRFRLLQTCGFIFYMIFAFIALFPPAAETSTIVEVLFPLTEVVIMRVPVESLIPVTLMLVTLVLGGLFYGFASILTQRILIDVIPNRIRNSVYSLQPTLAMIFALPLIMVVGPLIQYYGFPVAILLCGAISLLGVLMIRKGLSYPIPTADDAALAPKSAAQIEIEGAQESEHQAMGVQEVVETLDTDFTDEPM